MSHTPTRQCIACRGRAPRDELIRVVAAPDGSVVVDLKGRLPGRGAWVHPTPTCLASIEGKSTLLSRALRIRAAPAGIARDVRDAVVAATLDGLSFAAAAGGLVGGHDALAAALAGGTVVAWAVASDASERTVQSLVAAAGDLSPVVLPLDRDAIGARLGSAPRAAVGILPVPSCTHLRRQLRRLVQLG